MPLSTAQPTSPPPAKASSGGLKRIFVVAIAVPLCIAVLIGLNTVIAENAVEKTRRTVGAAGGKCDIERRVPAWLSAIAGEDFHSKLDQSVITRVVMQGSKIDDEQVSKIIAVPELEILDLEDTNVTSACLPAVAQLKSLKALRLLQSQVTDISELAKLPRLERLDFSFSKVRDADLAVLSQFPSLRAVNAGGCQVTDRGVAEIAKCPNLEEVGLGGAILGPEGLKPLQALKKLERLSLVFAVVDPGDLNALKEAIPGLKVAN